MGYHFIIDNKEIEYLQDSAEYDTLSPANWCIASLRKINLRIKTGDIVTIKKDATQFDKERTDLIENTDDFKKWLRYVFKGFQNALDNE